SDRSSRAIAGLSMGGAETFYIGLNHIDRFAYVAGMSSAFVMYPGASGGAGRAPGASAGAGRAPGAPRLDAAVFDKAFPSFDAKGASKLTLLYVACGVDDGLLGVN